jgi:phosphoribosylglycinamide formyltransferase-1
MLGVWVSGTGTNLPAILLAVRECRLHAEVSVVISNKPGVLALERAERARVPTICLPHKEYASREEFDAALVHALREAGVELVVLAGFMRLLTPTFLDAFPMRVVNIHPALLPAFPGVDAQRQAVEYGVKITGCTVHFVDEGTDTGPIVAQRAIAVEEADVDSLRQRLLKVEHELLVDALELIAKGRVTVVPGRDGERTRVTVRSE